MWVDAGIAPVCHILSCAEQRTSSNSDQKKKNSNRILGIQDHEFPVHQWISDICRQLWLEFFVRSASHSFIIIYYLQSRTWEGYHGCTFPAAGFRVCVKKQGHPFVTEGNGARLSMVCVRGYHKVEVRYLIPPKEWIFWLIDEFQISFDAISQN